MPRQRAGAEKCACLPAYLSFEEPVFSTDNLCRLSFLLGRDHKFLEPTPHDSLTGLPLCYAPRRDLPPPSVHPKSQRLADWEHLIPRAEVALAVDNPVLQTDLGRAALVNARIQWVDYNDHHQKKNNYFRGPVQPQTPEAMTLLLLMAEAGYIPEQAMDFQGDTPRIKILNRTDRDFLRDSGQVRMACESLVRKWLQQTVFEQNADVIIKERWLEFLRTQQIDKKIHLAHILAAKLVEQVVEPIDEPYRIAKKEGFIPEHLPQHPREFLKKKLFETAAHSNIINAMNHRFGRERRLQYPDGVPIQPSAA